MKLADAIRIKAPGINRPGTQHHPERPACIVAAALREDCSAVLARLKAGEERKAIAQDLGIADSTLQDILCDHRMRGTA